MSQNQPLLVGSRVRVLDSAELDGAPHPCAGLEAVIRMVDMDSIHVRLVAPPESGTWLWVVRGDQFEVLDDALKNRPLIR